MALKVVRKDNLFRIESQEFNTDWLPDTRENRKVMIVLLRLLTDENGKPIYTHKELASIVLSDNKQASSRHVELFRGCGMDFKRFILHKRKVNEQLVEAVLLELKSDPLAKVIQLNQRVNQRLERNDISKENILAALDVISCRQIRKAMLKQIAKGQAHYKEEYLLSEMMQSCENSKQISIEASEAEGMYLNSPTAVRSLLSVDTPLCAVDSSLKWLSFLMALYYHGVSLSVLGKWMKVHKTTILRWILSLALCLWPIISSWILRQIKPKLAYVDEKWLKIRGKWYYWFVVLDKETEIPVLTELLASTSKWSVRWIGVKLKRMRQIPSLIVTDGLASYEHITDKVKRVLCIFHHQQSVTRWLKERFIDKHQIDERKTQMKKVFQTNDKRTVKRRLAKLKQKAKAIQIDEWVKKTEEQLPKLLPQVGSRRIPKTNNAIERFFRAFNRFYKARNGFFSLISAKRELIFFLVMYLFIQQPHSGKAPLEKIMPEVRNMPFYQLVNDPLSVLMGTGMVNKKVNIADFQTKQCIAH